MQEELKRIMELTETMEERMNAEFAAMIDREGRSVTVNVLINAGTTMLSKALVMVREENRDNVIQAVMNVLASKIMDGQATIETLIAIDNAKNSTCRPLKKGLGKPPI